MMAYEQMSYTHEDSFFFFVYTQLLVVLLCHTIWVNKNKTTGFACATRVYHNFQIIYPSNSDDTI